jgi:hypothetical protein
MNVIVDHLTMRAIRLVGVILAAVASAWFVVGIRQARDVSRANAIVFNVTKISADQQRRADALLGSAALLNPDREVDLLRGQAALLAGHRAAARAELLGVVRSEPMNLTAWALLAQASPNDGALFNQAVRHITLLDPVAVRQG